MSTQDLIASRTKSKKLTLYTIIDGLSKRKDKTLRKLIAFLGPTEQRKNLAFSQTVKQARMEINNIFNVVEQAASAILRDASHANCFVTEKLRICVITHNVSEFRPTTEACGYFGFLQDASLQQ